MSCNLYFAYGSNLCEHDWKRWCDCNQHDGSGLTAVGTGVLPDHQLHFSHYSRARGGGALNVVPSPGQSVEGVLMTADERAWIALDTKEGAPNVYQRQIMTIMDSCGRPVQAAVYVLCKKMDRGFVAPTTDYVDAVRMGLVAHGLKDTSLTAAVNFQSLS